MAYQRSTPTPAELEQGASDLTYEVLMLSNTAALLEDDSKWNKGWGWQSKTLYMATVESFLTHARSLMDFVCPPGDYETRTIHARGIFAADYCSGSWRPPPWGDLRETHKRISVEIQHLSLDRPPVGSNWPYADMRNKLKDMLLDFLTDADQLSGAIKDQLRGVLVDGRHMAVADTGMAIPTAAITAITGVTGATTSMIDPRQVEPSG